MSILGEDGLLEDYKIRDNQIVIRVDKFVLLVLESARVEIALLQDYPEFVANKVFINELIERFEESEGDAREINSYPHDMLRIKMGAAVGQDCNLLEVEINRLAL
jgi:hypothetical protein